MASFEHVKVVPHYFVHNQTVQWLPPWKAIKEDRRFLNHTKDKRMGDYIPSKDGKSLGQLARTRDIRQYPIPDHNYNTQIGEYGSVEEPEPRHTFRSGAKLLFGGRGHKVYPLVVILFFILMFAML